MKKTLIAASVGALMLAAAGTASANSLLFPFFTTAAGATSILSISSSNLAAGGNASFTENLHYVYNYGKDCTHFDGMGKISANDLLQHSVAAPKAGGFGKVVAADGSTPFYFPLNDYGFLTVTSATTGGDGVIFGDMAVADPATGLIASYAGISNGAAFEGDFTAQGKTKFNLSFYPENLVQTNWYGVVTGSMTAAITGGLDWKGSVTLNNGTKVFDNDENSLSGNKEKVLTCAGGVAAGDLMNSAQAAAVGPNGGLIQATAVPFVAGAPGVPAGAADGKGLVMTKLQVLPGKVVLMHTESGT